MDKLAENLQRLNEDDLLLVVQMIHDKKSPETMTRNDVERKFRYFQHPRDDEWSSDVAPCRGRIPR